MILSIIFDWKRTLYNPETGTLIDGAEKILKMTQQRDLKVYLIGKGGQDMHEAVKKLKVEKYFDDIHFSEGEKDPTAFRAHIDDSMPTTTLVIGDRARSEIAIGSQLGATTIQVKQGKFADERPESPELSPTYIVSDLNDLARLVDKLLNPSPMSYSAGSYNP